MELSTAPTFGPLVETCRAHGISRSVAFELARAGKLQTFTIGTRRYVYTDSLRTLPERLAADAAKAAA
ncbi:MAG: hypothetical protein JSR65_06615 [Proteobacteria bacterium]|nr:hypothetical protein [Pseudomonadota bacterium]